MSEQNELVEIDIEGIKQRLPTAEGILDGPVNILEAGVSEFFVFPITKEIVCIKQTGAVSVNHTEVAQASNEGSEINQWCAVAVNMRYVVVASSSTTKKYNHYELFNWAQTSKKVDTVTSLSKLKVQWPNDDSEVARMHLCQFKNVVGIFSVRMYGYFDLFGIFKNKLIQLKVNIPGIITEGERRIS